MDEFIAYANRNNLTYAQAQIKETCGMMDEMIIPSGYSKIGDRKAGTKDECKIISESSHEIGQDHSEQDG